MNIIISILAILISLGTMGISTYRYGYATARSEQADARLECTLKLNENTLLPEMAKFYGKPEDGYFSYNEIKAFIAYTHEQCMRGN